MNVRHIGIVARSEDFEATRRFYRDFLGFQDTLVVNESGNFIDRVLGASQVNVKTLKMKNGSTTIELLEFSVPDTIQKRTLFVPGPTHFAVDVENSDELWQKLNGEFRCISPPSISDCGRFGVFFCQDPSGNFVEFVETLCD